MCLRKFSFQSAVNIQPAVSFQQSELIHLQSQPSTAKLESIEEVRFVFDRRKRNTFSNMVPLGC